MSLEYEIFMDLRRRVLDNSGRIIKAAQALAEMDVFVSLAEIAVRYNYHKPRIRTDGIINIVEGRHPVVERITDHFVPNDTYLTANKHLALITGPIWRVNPPICGRWR
jgi:DNA mismatch repair protein MutS